VLRISIAVRGRYTTESERITFHTPGPRAAIRAMARRIAGNAIRPSMTRMTTRSARR
jgi:hypothetical protein